MLDDIFQKSGADLPEGETYANAASGKTQRSEGAGIEDLFAQRTSILKTKLEVFASELFDRLRIHSRNLISITDNQGKLEAMIEQLGRQANYRLREHRDKNVLYEMLVKLEQEKRDQDVECWRDAVDVMKDFLIVWEALEQARARAVFLKT